MVDSIYLNVICYQVSKFSCYRQAAAAVLITPLEVIEVIVIHNHSTAILNVYRRTTLANGNRIFFFSKSFLESCWSDMLSLGIEYLSFCVKIIGVED